MSSSHSAPSPARYVSRRRFDTSALPRMFLVRSVPLVDRLILNRYQRAETSPSWSDDEGVLYGTREIEGAPVVSPIQHFLDLSRTKGRGEGAASAILEEVIKPTWH